MDLLPPDVNWKRIQEDMAIQGYAQLPNVLSPSLCRQCVEWYSNDQTFRKRIHMERYNFGVGDYAYFSEPLPKPIVRLRDELYTQLVPIANHMMESMGQASRYPATLKQFSLQCQRSGQSQPTPLILHYKAGGMNRLHRDLYGPIVFPVQAMVMLSRKELDFKGGEFVLVDTIPRQQSQVSVLSPDQGDLVIFPVCERPVKGKRRTLKATVRHGVSRILSGERWVLGIIFHDAQS